MPDGTFDALDAEGYFAIFQVDQIVLALLLIVIIVRGGQRLALVVQHDQLGEQLLRDQILELVEGVLAEVAGEVLGAGPEEDPGAREQDEEPRSRQRGLEGRHLARPLVQTGEAQDLEEHHVLLVLVVLPLVRRHLPRQVLVRRHNQAALERLQQVHGLVVHLDERAQVDLGDQIVAFDRLQVDRVLPDQLRRIVRDLHLVDRPEGVLELLPGDGIPLGYRALRIPVTREPFAVDERFALAGAFADVSEGR